MLESDNLPLIVAGALGLVWVACIFYGMGSLYQKNSPLYIIYMGSWACCILWYMKWSKNHPDVGKNLFVVIILALAVSLGLMLTVFGSSENEKSKARRKAQQAKDKADQ